MAGAPARRRAFRLAVGLETAEMAFLLGVDENSPEIPSIDDPQEIPEPVAPAAPTEAPSPAAPPSPKRKEQRRLGDFSD